MPSAHETTVDRPAGRVSPAAETVRAIAGRGGLVDHVRTLQGAEYTWLYGGAYEIAWPVAFDGLTRGVEHRRGHPRCARSVTDLAPDCLDGFEDDVEAVVDYLFRNGNDAIVNLEGWLASRLIPATVDGHRRRRGALGAQQRPRLPRWLATELDHDPWLGALAVKVLVWVGLPNTGALAVWPYGAWAEARAALTGDPTSTETTVVRDVETVLDAMRRRPAWYERFVETPLGRRQAPLLPAYGDAADGYRAQVGQPSIGRHESDDARLLELAALAVAAIESRLGCGDDERTVVVDVIRTAFAAGTGAEQLDAVPGTGLAEDERVTRLLADERCVDRLVSLVLDIVVRPE